MKYWIVLLTAITLFGCSRVGDEEKAVHAKMVDASIMAQARNRVAFHQLFTETQLLYGRFLQTKPEKTRQHDRLAMAMAQLEILNIVWDDQAVLGSPETADCLTRELALYANPNDPAPNGTCKTPDAKD